jgi:two-component system sensor histidine kinase and response regulator WspE
MKKVLIVEDETSLREVYVEIISDAGYDVLQAADGERAWEIIKEGQWDLLLLDIMLPKLDGMEVLKHVSDDANLKSKPVVVLSNLDNDSIVKQCLSQGASGYLIKANITPQDVLNTVNKHLDHA